MYGVAVARKMTNSNYRNQNLSITPKFSQQSGGQGGEQKGDTGKDSSS